MLRPVKDQTKYFCPISRQKGQARGKKKARKGERKASTREQREDGGKGEREEKRREEKKIWNQRQGVSDDG